MTPPPTNIDGTDITGASIDGQEVQEITVDGDTVFTAGPDIPDSGVLRYSFEDNSATDVWGSFDGTVNGPTYQPSGGPDGLGAFDFDEVDDFIEVPTGATDVIESTGSGSVYVEVNLDSIAEDYFLFSGNGSGRLELYMDAGGADTYRGGSQDLTSAFNGGAVSGSYQDVVLTVGGGTLEVYTDGSLTDSTSSLLDSNIDGLDIGRDFANGRHIDGKISDFRIYDKALSSTEVANLSNTGSIDGGPVPSAVAQYDATQISASNGDPITSWSDSIGSFDITGGSPEYQTNVQNGKPVVRYDGVDDTLDETGLSLSQPFSITVVAKYDTPELNTVLVSSQDPNERVFFLTDPDPRYRMFTDTGDIFGGSPNEDPRIFSLIFDGPSSKIRVNGVTVATGNVGTQSFEGVKHAIRGDTGGDVYEGWIGENVFYESNLETDGDLSNEEQRLSEKWGITI